MPGRVLGTLVNIHSTNIYQPGTAGAREKRSNSLLLESLSWVFNHGSLIMGLYLWRKQFQHVSPSDKLLKMS